VSVEPNLYYRKGENVMPLIQSKTQVQPATPPKDPIIAAVLSLILLGGAGQIYLGQQTKGIVLIVIWLLGLCTFGVVSTIVAIVGAIDAYQLATMLKNGQAVGEWQFFWEK
jgi:TM2 domain-containing membrane protein YozV